MIKGGGRDNLFIKLDHTKLAHHLALPTQGSMLANNGIQNNYSLYNVRVEYIADSENKHNARSRK